MDCMYVMHFWIKVLTDSLILSMALKTSQRIDKEKSFASLDLEVWIQDFLRPCRMFLEDLQWDPKHIELEG